MNGDAEFNNAKQNQLKKAANKKLWNVNIGTLFPGLFPGPLGVSCVGKSMGKFWDLQVQDLRSYAVDKHKTVDDTPCGGGPGMIIKPDILDHWINDIHENSDLSDVANSSLNSQDLDESQISNEKTKYIQVRKKPKIVYMSPRGALLKQSDLSTFLEQDLTILCGRYEGVDCRFLKHWDVEEVSIGDYILCGGEVAAFALIEACVRMIPGVLGNFDSTQQDSLSDGLLEHDQYTKPNSWVPKNSKIEYNSPCVLKSGNHGLIEEWKFSNSLKITQEVRPDLWIEYMRKKDKNA